MRYQHSAGERTQLRPEIIDFYLQRGRQLHAEAIHGYVVSLLRGLAGLTRRLVALLVGVPHSRLWRVPGSGNCFNC